MAKFTRRDALLKKLAAMPDAVRSAVRQALAEGADEMTAAMRNLAPADSGDLRRSIGSTFGTYRPANANVRGVSAGAEGDPDLTVTIHAGDEKAFYAAFVEFGTAPHVNGGRFAGSKHPGNAPQPFFFPAFRANRKRVKARISRATTKAVKTVARS